MIGCPPHLQPRSEKIKMPNPPQLETTYLKQRELTKTFSARLTTQNIRERAIELCMFLAALSSVAITIGIVAILLSESWHFFKNVSILNFLTDTQWTVLFENPRYGIMPLVAGTVVTSGVALLVALPLGTCVAVYLS